MSENYSETNKRIAKNTLILYVRMGVMMVIGFFTTRITLSALGVENYGIYSVVGGLVSMFSLISNSLSASISRFLTFGLGKGDLEHLKKVFGVSMNIQLFLALIIIIGVETVGLWFLNHKLVIPADKMFAANVVFQLSIGSFIIGLLSMPYNAVLVAHEKMSAFAYMTLFEATCKLLIVFALLYIDGNKLIIFAALLFLQGLISQLIYWIYCKIHFQECKYTFVKDKPMYSEIFHFAGWNFIGCTAALLNDQGVNITLNLFFGPIVNTARGIGNQITGILAQFSNNFMTALNPQITKNYAMNELDRMQTLMFKGAKLSYYLFLIVSLPILLETHKVLMVWLGQSPQYTVGFARLAIILSLVNILSNTLITAQLATGKLKLYQICVGGTLLLNLPISYVTLKLGASPTSVMIVAIAIAQICMFLRLYFLRTMVGLSMRRFLKEVYLKVITVTLFSIPIPMMVYLFMPDNLFRFVSVILVSIVTTSAIVYNVGCDAGEKSLITRQIKKFKKILVRA